MSDLRDLYQEVIIDHSKRPRNYRPLEAANRRAEGYNPLCGDTVSLFVLIEDGVVKDCAFQGHGCAISTASASMMTDAVKARPLEEVERTIDDFLRMVKGEGAGEDALGKLAAFEGVREFPARVKCATLPWHSLRSALRGGDETVTTE
jgi:nitrogen fixation NifU-like protein